jgi:hypothetical protein
VRRPWFTRRTEAGGLGGAAVELALAATALHPSALSYKAYQNIRQPDVQASGSCVALCSMNVFGLGNYGLGLGR